MWGKRAKQYKAPTHFEFLLLLSAYLMGQSLQIFFLLLIWYKFKCEFSLITPVVPAYAFSTCYKSIYSTPKSITQEQTYEVFIITFYFTIREFCLVKNKYWATMKNNTMPYTVTQQISCTVEKGYLHLLNRSLFFCGRSWPKMWIVRFVCLFVI